MNVLFKKYSTMTQEKVFSDTFSTTALAVYDEFESTEALAYMDLQELTAFIIKKGKNRFPDPDAVAKAIQKAARSSYRLPKTVNDLSLIHIYICYSTGPVTIRFFSNT